jgi:hypothetical protein
MSPLSAVAVGPLETVAEPPLLSLNKPTTRKGSATEQISSTQDVVVAEGSNSLKHPNHDCTVGWPAGEPVGGRTLALLTDQPALWNTFVLLLERLLCSELLKAQRDAAWAVQVVAFSSEVLCQRLIDAGMQLSTYMLDLIVLCAS